MLNSIEQWFESGVPFEEGVALYLSLPNTKPHVVRSLNRGKNSYNKALLIKELRQIKATPPEPKKKKQTPKPNQKVTDQTIAAEHLHNQQKQQSANKLFGQIKYAELPSELKLRFREAKDIFYNLCDLKIALNSVAPENRGEALAIQLQIEELDDQRTLIWKELEHWQKHKTLLPTETDDFSGLNSDELRTKKARIASSMSKMQKRVDGWYDDLASETDSHQQRLIENKINKAEKDLHQKDLNTKKIDELL